MKRFLLWILGVVLGVAVFLGIVMGISWASADKSDLPETQGMAFGGQPLAQNGYCWQVPLLGAIVDKVFYSAPTLTVQKLGTLNDAHPALALPEWAGYTTLDITDKESGQQIFSGTGAEYAAFAYPANSTYEVVVRLWHLPDGLDPAAVADGEKALVKSPGLEAPAKPVGWYSCRFRFTLAATPAVVLSSDNTRQGGTLSLTVTGMLGSEAPAADTDLGTVVFQPVEGGWRGYVGVAYNADTGTHTITVRCGEQSAAASVLVNGRQYGTVEVNAEPEPTEQANAEFRNTIWPLYSAESGAQQWYGAWQCPVQYTDVLVDYGMVKTVGGKAGSKSNSTLLATAAGSEVVAPAGGRVVFAGALELTGNTLVIDHGCGVRTYLYGLQELYVAKGDAVFQNGPLGTTGESMTVDVKIGSKSVCPWDLFRGQGGLFAP